MVKHSSRQLIFFALIFLMFFLFLRLSKFWLLHNSQLNEDIIDVFTSIAYTSIIVAIYYLAKLNTRKSEKFWDISPGALCKGGEYMWQGDSKEAKMCRALASTPEGRSNINAYNCPVGYNGIPKIPFEYTPLSNDNWQNERTMDIQ
jgi:hypothetical protein